MGAPSGLETEQSLIVSARDGHDCAWEKYILEHRPRSFGGTAILHASDITFLEARHTDGVCEPTHGIAPGPVGPTRQWADLVQTDFH